MSPLATCSGLRIVLVALSCADAAYARQKEPNAITHSWRIGFPQFFERRDNGRRAGKGPLNEAARGSLVAGAGIRTEIFVVLSLFPLVLVGVRGAVLLACDV